MKSTLLGNWSLPHPHKKNTTIKYVCPLDEHRFENFGQNFHNQRDPTCHKKELRDFQDAIEQRTF